MAWHKSQPVEPSFQRELTAKTKWGISWKLCWCINELTFSFAFQFALTPQFDADD
jgi:hypothetical protein